MNELHTIQACSCGHADQLHAHRVKFPEGGESQVICQHCEMERDLFPAGFLRDERNERAMRDFLIERLAIPSNTQDVERASGAAYLALPQWKRDQFHSAWIAFLGTLE